MDYVMRRRSTCRWHIKNVVVTVTVTVNELHKLQKCSVQILLCLECCWMKHSFSFVKTSTLH